MRNESLYKSLKKYCKEALDLINTEFKQPGKVPMRIKEKVEVTGPGSLSQTYVEEIEWSDVVFRTEKALKDTNTYQAVVLAMQQDKKISEHLNTLVGTPESRMKMNPDRCLQVLLTQLLLKQQGIDFREDLFNQIYQSLENFFYEKLLEHRISSPLNRFKMEAETIELGPGFSINKISKEEKGKLLSEARQFGFISTYDILPFPEYAFGLYLKTPKVIGDSDTISQEDSPIRIASKLFDEACSALRLFKQGAVGYANLRMESTSWDPIGGIRTLGSGVGGRLRGSPYLFTEDETQAFSEFWPVYQKCRQVKRNRIEIALRRMNFAYERARPEDKLMDYLIGFEALLLKKEEKQELAYRLALRGSILLADKPDERIRIFSELKTAYNERSNIVHGGQPKEYLNVSNTKVPFNQFVDKLEDHLRSAIKKFLERCEKQSESQVIKHLDTKIIRGS